MEYPIRTEDDLDLDFDEEITDDLETCKYLVYVVGLNPDKTETDYCKQVGSFDDAEQAVSFAWGIGKETVADCDSTKTFLITVEEAIGEEEELVGTIAKIDLVV